MPAGYSSRCKACGSPHRGEIDRRLLAGASTRSVEAWLKAEHGETIAFPRLASHKAAHLDVVAEVRERSVAAAAPAFEAAVEQVEARLDALEEVGGIALRVARALERTMSDPEAKHSAAQVTLFMGCLREARGASVDQHKQLHGGTKADDFEGGLGEFLGLALEDGPSEGADPAVGA